jgi:hypothetical protein
MADPKLDETGLVPRLQHELTPADRRLLATLRSCGQLVVYRSTLRGPLTADANARGLIAECHIVARGVRSAP